MKSMYCISALLALLMSCNCGDGVTDDGDDCVENELCGCNYRMLSLTDSVIACGIEDPAKNRPWLAEIIRIAGSDQPVRGTIWHTTYKEKDVFLTDMHMNGFPNPSYVFQVFDCDGNQAHIDVKDIEQFYLIDITYYDVVYTNSCYHIDIYKK